MGRGDSFVKLLIIKSISTGYPDSAFFISLPKNPVNLLFVIMFVFQKIIGLDKLVRLK